MGQQSTPDHHLSLLYVLDSHAMQATDSSTQHSQQSEEPWLMMKLIDGSIANAHANAHAHTEEEAEYSTSSSITTAASLSAASSGEKSLPLPSATQDMMMPAATQDAMMRAPCASVQGISIATSGTDCASKGVTQSEKHNFPSGHKQIFEV